MHPLESSRGSDGDKERGRGTTLDWWGLWRGGEQCLLSALFVRLEVHRGKEDIVVVRHTVRESVCVGMFPMFLGPNIGAASWCECEYLYAYGL